MEDWPLVMGVSKLVGVLARRAHLSELVPNVSCYVLRIPEVNSLRLFRRNQML